MARIACLKEIPCVIENVDSEKEPDRFLELLVVYNQSRVKDIAEVAHEQAIKDNHKGSSYKSLIAARKKYIRVKLDKLELGEVKTRIRITEGKTPFLDAVLKVCDELKAFWPISQRQIHYNLLNNPPMKSDRADSRYKNDQASSQSLSNLVTRARIEGLIPEGVISDETRPVIVWKTDREPNTFIAKEFDGFLTGYWRDLLQSQPHHIELLVEKNTVANTLRDLAMEYTIPMTSGRGYSSLPPRIKMKNRYKKSGKDKLILLIISDFDPDGEVIAESFARSMRDDFGIEKIYPVKVALTLDQTADLKESFDVAKPGSPGYKQWMAKYGKRQTPYEVEALAPDKLISMVRKAIDKVLDRERFNLELKAEKLDAGKIEALRKAINTYLKDVKI